MTELDNLKKLKKALEEGDTITALGLVEKIKEEEILNNYPSMRRFDFNRQYHNKDPMCCEFHSYFEIAKECLDK